MAFREPTLKSLHWVGSAKKDLSGVPRPVKRKVGFALYLAQAGQKHPAAKVLKGFGSAGVLEVVEDFRSDAYRAVYTVRFARAVYVLHCFKKKSTKGAQTPKPDAELIRARLRAVEQAEREG
jgi:phage-related protein